MARTDRRPGLGTTALIGAVLAVGCGVRPTAPTSSADCQRSEACKKHGACVYSRQRAECVHTSTRHCRLSTGCRQHGACALAPDRSGCRIGSDDDCRRSRDCKQRGQCWRSDPRWCIAVSNADCRRSAECEERRRCILKHGVCETGEVAESTDCVDNPSESSCRDIAEGRAACSQKKARGCLHAARVLETTLEQAHDRRPGPKKAVYALYRAACELESADGCQEAGELTDEATRAKLWTRAVRLHARGCKQEPGDLTACARLLDHPLVKRGSSLRALAARKLREACPGVDADDTACGAKPPAASRPTQ